MNRSLKDQPLYARFCDDKPGWLDDVILDAFLARTINDDECVALPTGSVHAFVNALDESAFPRLTSDQKEICWKAGTVKKVFAPINIENVH